ncbi:hypothetical protein PC129_g11655 [Phytophthora cactorum]|uniref:Uncharacterized protein n=1 Tax=Phytophthora cactorum TaxID=29920 RepID=A0A8T1I081_9STRA|nr:hypothetical protein PC129_g11655 [Phytophthora cactorum]
MLGTIPNLALTGLNLEVNEYWQLEKSKMVFGEVVSDENEERELERREQERAEQEEEKVVARKKKDLTDSTVSKPRVNTVPKELGMDTVEVKSVSSVTAEAKPIAVGAAMEAAESVIDKEKALVYETRTVMVSTTVNENGKTVVKAEEVEEPIIAENKETADVTTVSAAIATEEGENYDEYFDAISDEGDASFVLSEVSFEGEAEQVVENVEETPAASPITESVHTTTVDSANAVSKDASSSASRDPSGEASLLTRKYPIVRARPSTDVWIPPGAEVEDVSETVFASWTLEEDLEVSVEEPRVVKEGVALSATEEPCVT